MELNKIMTHYVETIRSDASLQQAAQQMASLEVGMLPVMDEYQVVGTITDRDITVRATTRGLDPKKTPVRSAMSEFVIFGFEAQDVRDAARIMMDNQIRRLPILNQDKKLAGIVSLGDLSKALDDKRLAGQVLASISETTEPQVLEHLR